MAQDAWNDYFDEAAKHPFLVFSSLRQQLADAEDEIFSDSSRIFIYNTFEGLCRVERIESPNQLDEYLKYSSRGVTVVSITSSRTNAPLNITSNLASHLLSKLRVEPDFLRVLLSFGKGPQQTDASHGYQDFRKLNADDYLISYKLNYFERNDRSGPDSWSSRHAGIYHRHESGSDLFILLNCAGKTDFVSTMRQLFQETDNPSAAQKRLLSIEQTPQVLHSMLVSSYADNWKPYFHLLSTRFSAINDLAMVSSADRVGQESFDRVQRLRHIYDMTLFANACCEGNIKIIESLTSAFGTSEPASRPLITALGCLTGSRDSSGVLQKRIQNAIDLVGYTLSLHNQLETAKLDVEIRDMTQHMENLAQENRDMTERMKDLAQETSLVTKKLQELQQDTVDDSAIVNVLTIASAIYLPGSFVGTLFGMNFFDYDHESQGIVIGSNFWIFILLWFVFIVFTTGLFVATWWFKKRDIPRPWKRGGRKATISKA